MRALPFVFLLGCSIINDPPAPYDASVDANPDAHDGSVDSEIDSEIDAGMQEVCDVSNDEDEDTDGLVNCADVDDCEGMSCRPTEGLCECRNARATELDCTNGEDDDGDGTTDCGDFDCADQQLAECCGTGMRPGHWPDDVCPSTAWVTRGDGEAECAGGVLEDFNHTEPFSIVWPDCLSLALGATIQFSVAPRGGGTCTDGAHCDEHVRILIAERDMPRESNRLFFAELAVEVHASGRIELTQGDAPIPDAFVDLAELPASGAHEVRVELRPDVSDSGEPQLRARVFYNPSGMVMEDELWEGFVIPLDQLITDGECREVPGLYLAVEGLGDLTPVSDLEVDQSECSNPNLFQPSLESVLTPYDYMTAGTTSLELDPARLIDAPRAELSWATQALSSPTLLQSEGEWLVAAEASNDQPANEPSFRVGYAIAHRRNSTWTEELTGWTDGGSDTPWIGNQPPSCLDGSCSGEFSPEMPPYPSVRDPFLFATATGAEVIAFASEMNVDGEPRSETFGIHIAALSSFETDSTVTAASLVLEPSDVSTCDSLRDPAVTARPGGTELDFWLFFTCYEGLSSRGIYAVPMTAGVGFEVPSGATAVPVLTPDRLDFGRGGTLRSPELVLDTDGDDAVFAMWFLVGQEVGVAIGRGKDSFVDSASTGDVPILQLFEGNPVLVPSDRAFSRACSGCSIEGLAVTRTGPTELRFLIARENDDTPARYDLLPLDQTWRNLARP